MRKRRRIHKWLVPFRTFTPARQSTQLGMRAITTGRSSFSNRKKQVKQTQFVSDLMCCFSQQCALHSAGFNSRGQPTPSLACFTVHDITEHPTGRKILGILTFDKRHHAIRTSISCVFRLHPAAVWNMKAFCLDRKIVAGGLQMFETDVQSPKYFSVYVGKLVLRHNMKRQLTSKTRSI